MTIEQYLNEQYADPRAATGSLVWFPSTLTNKQKAQLIKDADTNPYCVVTYLDENERVRTHDGRGIIDQVVFLNLEHNPVDGSTPNLTQLNDVYEVIRGTLPYQVDEISPSKAFISIERGPTMTPPAIRQQTTGLYARISFRLKYMIL